MKFNLKLSQALLCFSALTLTSISNVHANFKVTNYVEVFYDNINNLGKSKVSHIEVKKEESLPIEELESINGDQIAQQNFSTEEIPPVTTEGLVTSNYESVEPSELEKQALQLLQKGNELIFPEKNSLTIPPIENTSNEAGSGSATTNDLEKGLNQSSKISKKHNTKTANSKDLNHPKKDLNHENKSKEIKRPVTVSSAVPKPKVEDVLSEDTSLNQIVEENNKSVPPQASVANHSIEPPYIPSANNPSIEHSLNESSVNNLDSTHKPDFIDNMQILPEETQVSPEPQREIIISEELNPEKTVAPKDSASSQPNQRKKWRDYIPFFKKNESNNKLEAKNVPINKQDIQSKIPSLPENNLDSSLEEARLSIPDSHANLSLYFDNNEINLSDEDKYKIDQLILLAKKTQKQLKVISYTEEENADSRKIALQRVIGVRQYVVSNGLESEGVTVQVLPLSRGKSESLDTVNCFLVGSNG